MRRGGTSAGCPLNVPPPELCLGGRPPTSRHTPHLCLSKLCPFCRAPLDAPLFCVPQICWAHPWRGPPHASWQKLHLQEGPRSARRRAGSPALHSHCQDMWALGVHPCPAKPVLRKVVFSIKSSFPSFEIDPVLGSSD